MKRILFLLAFEVIIPASAFAWAGKLSTPQLAFAEDTPKETVKKVDTFINKDLTFVEGSFFNALNTMRFSGSTAKLNDLIQLLHNAQLEVKVTFDDFKDDRVTLSLVQDTTNPKKVAITINATKKDIKWSDLKIQIPPVKGKVQTQVPPKKPGPNKP